MNLLDKLITTQDIQINEDKQFQAKQSNFCFCLNLKKYFDVEEQQIFQRIKSSIIMKPSFCAVIGDRPDLYGPFWITTTLIVIIVASSSLMLLFSQKTYNFNQIPVAACLIYGIQFGCPYTIAIVLKIFGSTVSVVELICIYGYSLTIFLPVTIFCFIDSFWIQIILLIISYCISCIFLIRGILSLDRKLGQKQKIVLTLFILGIQFILVLMYKYYFFHLI